MTAQQVGTADDPRWKGPESSGSSRGPAGPRRSMEIDIYRGLAVIGVVFSHVLDGVTNAGLLSSDSPLNTFNA